MNIMHVASFSGNIGDEANHIGFRRKMNEHIDTDITYTNVEIRKFYKNWGIEQFDEQFVERVNEHDMLVIGGGNFFEICWDYSSTGTTIDIEEHILDQIKVPIFFNGVGVDDGKGITENNLRKFGRFLECINKKSNCLLSVRNDGSYDILKKYYDEALLKNIHKIPDGGFFFKGKERTYNEINKDCYNIGINVAGDMLEKRFNNEDQYKLFITNFAEIINTIVLRDKNINIIFLPHIYADYISITDILSKLNDHVRRNYTAVAPLLNGNLDGGEYIFSLYKQCDLVLGMRFHANVCAIGQDVPTVGIVSYHKHRELYRELNLSDRCFDLTNMEYTQDMWDNIKMVIEDTLANRLFIQEKYKKLNNRLEKEIDDFYRVVLKKFIQGSEKNENR